MEFENAEDDPPLLVESEKLPPQHNDSLEEHANEPRDQVKVPITIVTGVLGTHVSWVTAD